MSKCCTLAVQKERAAIVAQNNNREQLEFSEQHNIVVLTFGASGYLEMIENLNYEENP